MRSADKVHACGPVALLVCCAQDGRMSMAGLSAKGCDTLAAGIADTLRQVPAQQLARY